MGKNGTDYGKIYHCTFFFLSLLTTHEILCFCDFNSIQGFAAQTKYYQSISIFVINFKTRICTLLTV